MVESHMPTFIMIIILFLAKARIISPGEKESIIQYGYWKCGTHARVFSRTLPNGSSKNEMNKKTEEEGEKSDGGNEYSGHERKEDSSA